MIKVYGFGTEEVCGILDNAAVNLGSRTEFFTFMHLINCEHCLATNLVLRKCDHDLRKKLVSGMNEPLPFSTKKGGKFGSAS